MARRKHGKRRCGVPVPPSGRPCRNYRKANSPWCASHQTPASRRAAARNDQRAVGLALHDTLTGEVRPLSTRQPGRVDIYACGPTVYDHPHLGHARSALTYDILRRYLEWTGAEVRHAANVTDIDDKIIQRANDEDRDTAEVAAHWEKVYTDAMASLGVLAPHHRPRATEWVSQMIALIGEIMDKGGAYRAPSGVYLRVRQAHGYGDLVHRDVEDLRSSSEARVDDNPDKEDPLDFALWKAAKPGEPSWPSPWGPGRPGWHIECAAMSLGIFGDGFDIHGGGSDLMFPHHTNERAEAQAAGREFATHWMHNAMLNVDGHKMGKSLRNYRTVDDLLAEHPQNGRAFRLLVLQTHYRKTMEVNPELLASARAAVERLDALARRSPDSGTPRRDDAAVDAFTAAMDNDLGTPEAVAVLFAVVRRANAAIDAGDDEAAALAATAADLAAALGLAAGPGQDHQDDALIESLVAQRQQARNRRDWATADACRTQLAEMGVAVEDSADGPRWRRA